jgi:hypothetical protein
MRHPYGERILHRSLIRDRIKTGPLDLHLQRDPIGYAAACQDRVDLVMRQFVARPRGAGDAGLCEHTEQGGGEPDDFIDPSSRDEVPPISAWMRPVTVVIGCLRW